MADGRSRLRPAAPASDGRHLRPQRRGGRGGSEPSRLGVLDNRLEAVGREGRHRSDRHLHSRRHPCRDRDRGARGRQACAVRKAGLEHRGRSRSDVRGCRGSAAAGYPVDGGLQLPQGARPGPGEVARRRWKIGGNPARACVLPPGLDRRSGVSACLETAKGSRRLWRAWRHRRTHRRSRPVHPRRRAYRRKCTDRNVRQGKAVAGGLKRVVGYRRDRPR